jgi:hypothetical protein
MAWFQPIASHRRSSPRSVRFPPAVCARHLRPTARSRRQAGCSAGNMQSMPNRRRARPTPAQLGTAEAKATWRGTQQKAFEVWNCRPTDNDNLFNGALSVHHRSQQAHQPFDRRCRRWGTVHSSNSSSSSRDPSFIGREFRTSQAGRIAVCSSAISASWSCGSIGISRMPRIVSSIGYSYSFREILPSSQTA